MAVWPEIPADSFHVETRISPPENVKHHLDLATKYAEDAAAAQAESAKQRRMAARALKDKGMTVRDIGAAQGMSYQRAQQLAS